MNRHKTLKQRRRLARSLEQAAVPERPFLGRGPRYLLHPSVSAACAPTLQAIATALRNDTSSIDDETMRMVRGFITGPNSPLFEGDAAKALRQAVRIQHLLIDTGNSVDESGTTAVQPGAVAATG